MKGEATMFDYCGNIANNFATFNVFNTQRVLYKGRVRSSEVLLWLEYCFDVILLICSDYAGDSIYDLPKFDSN